MRRIVMSSFALLLLTSFVLTACGGGSGDAAARKGVLTVVPSPIGDFSDIFNPFVASYAYGTFGLVYEPLLAINRFTGDTKPWLAASHSYSPDGQTLTFTLRTDVQWSDGQAFTANDVAFTFNLLKQFPATDTNSLWKILTSVTATDPSTVTMQFNEPAVPELWYIAFQTPIVPQHIFASFADPTKVKNDPPVGTGPYVLDTFNSQAITYKFNPKYWAPDKVKVAKVRYPAVSSNTSADLVLQSSQLDWAGVFTSNIDAFAKASPDNHFYWPGGNVTHLYLNLTKAPYNDLAFRQAVSTAIDRQALVKQAELGLDTIASPTGLLPSQKSFLDGAYSSLAFGPQDLAKARGILDTAGYMKDGNGKYLDKATGKPITFAIAVVDGWTDWDQATQIMAKNLNDLGLDVTVHLLQYGDYFSALQQGQFDAAMSWSSPGPTPYYYYYSLLSSKQTAPVGQNAYSNYWRYSDHSTDQLLAQAASTTDPAVQQTAFAGLQQVMVDQLPAIPLFNGATFYEYSTANFTGWPDADHLYASPSPYSFPDAEQVILNLSPR